MLRIITALVGVPVLLLVAWKGGGVLLLAVGALYLAGLRENLRLLSGVGLAPSPLVAYLIALTLLLVTYFYPEQFPGALVYALLLSVLPLVVFFPRYSPPEAGVTFLSTSYLSLFLYLYLLRYLPQGRHWLLLALVVTWVFDTVAYFAGRYLGKRHLTPRLSPGKTVEGFAAGLFASALVASLFARWLPVGAFSLFLLGAAAGVAAQVGDLVFSAVKRAAGHKDAGRIIPGHGGVLDRFDSMLLTAPLIYVAARLLT
ncbi:phosphatidate cytidylyltransferase [Thermodesulfitimonas sp.]